MKLLKKKHKRPGNLEIPESLYPNSQEHKKIQKLNRRALYAVGKVGSRLAEEPISVDDVVQSRKDIKDAITLMAATSHKLHIYQAGNEM